MRLKFCTQVLVFNNCPELLQPHYRSTKIKKKINTTHQSNNIPWTLHSNFLQSTIQRINQILVSAVELVQFLCNYVGPTGRTRPGSPERAASVQRRLRLQQGFSEFLQSLAPYLWCQGQRLGVSCQSSKCMSELTLHEDDCVVYCTVVKRFQVFLYVNGCVVLH